MAADPRLSRGANIMMRLVSTPTLTGPWPAVSTTALVATVTVMPGFTVGALAAPIAADLHISHTSLGLAMSAFYAATALGSPAATRLAAALPVPLILATAGIAASTVMITLSRTTGFATLLAVLIAGGFTNGLVQPAAGRVIATRIPVRRRSLAAGLVGAALGAATLVPGLLVAFVLPSHGWRTAMCIAGLVALLPVVFTGATRCMNSPLPLRPVAAGSHTPHVRRILLLWALAAGLSATGNNAVASYFIQLGQHSGTAASVAGNLLATSAILAVVVRLVTGALSDRAPSHNPAVITAMMLAGALGLASIAVGTPAMFVSGAVLAFSAGWGWTGLLLATTLHLLPGRAEKAGHTVQVGIYTGATIAPFAFGALASAFGFTVASAMAAALGLAAAAAMALGIRLLHSRT
ncbi:hypothetical protein B0T44_08070 [Nocardia donostiensis]|uniref:Major facilitator superfamily (MFS) profile domain-containing protein n=2 Tax=Nocardia donostiensis TaxID=1538463 RepID=A0A1W0BG27_9NOCA|nr:hypothetical protein B0T46_15465 [Nocardia donostiensis]OQS21552.1 hypothetical protein B0T44_08070 [Nocardia donostiensis]